MNKLNEEKNKTINARVEKSERPIQKWFTKVEPLHDPKCNKGTEKVSKGISNSLNIIDLMKTDQVFAKLFT